MTRAVTRHAVRVYAAVSALRGDRGDVLDALIPFFTPVLQLLDHKLFDPKAFARGIQTLYGWNFTTEIVETFIPRLVKIGYLQKLANNGTSSAYGVTYSGTTEDSAADANIAGVFESIVDRFVGFPDTVSDLLHYNLSRDELADILLRFLVETRSPSPRQHQSRSVGDAVPPAVDMEEGGRELGEEDRYLAARFIQSLTKEEPQLIDHLAQIASIGLLAEVVDDFSHPLSVPGNVELAIYLDAPVALDYLGLSGTAIGADVAKVLDSLREIGCKILVFPITCKEMSRNLSSMLALPPPRRHGYTHEAILKGEVLTDYVRAVANSPETALKAKGVEVRKSI